MSSFTSNSYQRLYSWKAAFLSVSLTLLLWWSTTVSSPADVSKASGHFRSLYRRQVTEGPPAASFPILTPLAGKDGVSGVASQTNRTLPTGGATFGNSAAPILTSSSTISRGSQLPWPSHGPFTNTSSQSLETPTFGLGTGASSTFNTSSSTVTGLLSTDGLDSTGTPLLRSEISSTATVSLSTGASTSPGTTTTATPEISSSTANRTLVSEITNTATFSRTNDSVTSESTTAAPMTVPPNIVLGTSTITLGATTTQVFTQVSGQPILMGPSNIVCGTETLDLSSILAKQGPILCGGVTMTSNPESICGISNPSCLPAQNPIVTETGAGATPTSTPGSLQDLLGLANVQVDGYDFYPMPAAFFVPMILGKQLSNVQIDSGRITLPGNKKLSIPGSLGSEGKTLSEKDPQVKANNRKKKGRKDKKCSGVFGWIGCAIGKATDVASGVANFGAGIAADLEKGAFDTISNNIGTAFDGVNDMFEFGNDIVDELGNDIEKAISEVTDRFEDIGENLADIVKSSIEEVTTLANQFSVVKSLVDELVKNDLTDEIANTVKDLLKTSLVGGAAAGLLPLKPSTPNLDKLKDLRTKKPEVTNKTPEKTDEKSTQPSTSTTETSQSASQTTSPPSISTEGSSTPPQSTASSTIVSTSVSSTTSPSTSISSPSSSTSSSSFSSSSSSSSSSILPLFHLPPSTGLSQRTEPLRLNSIQ
ncbi:hypothetical protein BCR34DRAFT_345254 [Clohesyomyces aquaticus]|uniref:Uncharacterized protein n=1 Tax=Clohesyomyces aquaticus TaxID=1231657 RepID=A0A1Y1ZKB1_9PLEO|nr:hypothetical protein BCR34DRAFT_345254 [Clohesyomyces aquaticus]